MPTMKIEAKDFPLYELLLRLNQPGVENAKQGFAEAQTGNDDKKYSFALGLYGLANTPGIEEGLTGFNARMRDQTLKSCLAVFEDIGARKHPWGALMAATAYAYGQGCDKDIVKARNWLNVAEDNGARDNDFTRQLRGQLGPRIFCRVKRPPTP
jgi:TPR repeat protein